ncbi:hypothetical protein JCM33374_g5777 [Metschnikowia sp. JCM 33374]|nr:hypothetical protein JCM33374_g5777 [Metschnikowia sp. JCM 33374]
MYGSHNTDHILEHQGGDGSPELSENYPTLPENEHFQFPPPRRHTLYQNFVQGPISAPAVPYQSEDYFSWDSDPSGLSLNPSGSRPVHIPSQDTHKQNNVNISSQATRSIRGPSNPKIRHRSNLSHTYVDESSSSVPVSLFPRQEHVYGQESHSLGVENSPTKAKFLASKGKPKPKPNKNPGFFLKLDDLKPPHSPLNKVKHQHRAFSSPSSDPNHGSMYNKMDFFEPDVFLQQSSAGEIAQVYENTTPLMFPPNADDVGYFGHLSQTENPSKFENGVIPGGYLNVTSKIYDPVGHSGTSGNNSDIDSYLNFQVDEFNSAQTYKNQYESYVGENVEEIDNKKIEAHFVPVTGLNHSHSYDQSYDEHQNHHHHDDHQAYNDSHGEHGQEHTNQHFTQDQKPHNTTGYSHNHYHHDSNYNQDQPHLGQDHNFNHEAKHAQDRFDHSYINLHQGHVDGHDLVPYQDISLPQPQIEAGESYSKHHQNPSYQDYSYEDNKSYLKSELDSSVPLEPDSLSDSQIVGKTVESSDTDQLGPAEKKSTAKKRKGVKGIVCSVCDKHIVRDLSRHMRIHDEAGRFQCIFPPGYCKHKSRKFNRPYDYKKHLLNVHFKFDDPAAKLAPNLTEKLNVRGQCNACGQRFVASDWLDTHILTSDLRTKCFQLQRMEILHKNDQEGKEPSKS